MGTLKLIGYLVAAVALLTALVLGASFIIVAGIAFGILCSGISATVFTAGAIKGYFERPK